MPQTPKNWFSILSFCLPGLGQVILRQFAEGLVWFLLFATGLSVERLWLLLPLTTVGAAFRAYFTPQHREISNAYRIGLTLVAGSVFFLWMSLATSRLFPVTQLAK